MSFISNHVDILVLTETKLDETFPTSSFLTDGFSSPFRLDPKRKGGGIRIHVRSDIPCQRLTKHSFPNDIEGYLVKSILEKANDYLSENNKYYHPLSQNNQYYFDCLDKALDVYGSY